jgi:hypothetical protein
MQSRWHWRFRNSVLGKQAATACPRIPVLTYHAAHAHGYDYAGNDHLALEHDLKLIHQMGFGVAKLQDVVDFVLGRAKPALHEGRWVALTFDDAPDCEYFDLYHPDFGCLKSFYRILVESAETGGADRPAPTAVSFAIADVEARAALDRACFAGRGHWRDSWWHEAAETGVLAFGNHSWDHAHPAVAVIRQREQRKGTFLGIDNETDADLQVTAAQRYIWFCTAGLAAPFFAYPYGEAPDYLRLEYFPSFQQRHKIEAAFGTQGDYATVGADRWHIPRFVCGQHWRSTDELAAILARSARVR